VKIYRFKYKDKISYGVLKEDELFPVTGSIYRKFQTIESGIPIGDVFLLPPVLPTKIVAIGRNYKDHALEMGMSVPQEPLIFLKPSTAIVGPHDIIIYPKMSKRVDYEGELAVIIKKKARFLDDHAHIDDYILGYTCFNDVTARDLQRKDVQFTRGKSFDTFAPCGPCIVTDIDPSQLKIKTFLNGKLRQSGNTKNLIFPVPYLMKFISQVMTLNPGDMIATGTPAGIGSMAPGDRVDVQIEGIGVLSNKVMRIK
jgi:2-keto-4-pentenoate hydratase/2-oxohepta-3-ene-1,7-dioic acid hydratase in catechol pathway